MYGSSAFAGRARVRVVGLHPGCPQTPTGREGARVVEDEEPLEDVLRAVGAASGLEAQLLELVEDALLQDAARVDLAQQRALDEARKALGGREH